MNHPNKLWSKYRHIEETKKFINSKRNDRFKSRAIYRSTFNSSTSRGTILTGFSLTTIYVKSMYKVRGFVRESMCPLPE